MAEVLEALLWRCSAHAGLLLSDDKYCTYTQMSTRKTISFSFVRISWQPSSGGVTTVKVTG
jgi:hypothetical protein